MKVLYIPIVLIAFSLVTSCGEDKKEQEPAKTPSNNVEKDTTAIDTAVVDIVMEVDTALTDTGYIEPPKEVAGKEDEAGAAKAAKKMFDLSEYGFNMSIELPVAAKFDYDADFEQLNVTFGKDFIMEIAENCDGPISELKGKFKNNMHNEFLGYVKEEDNGIIRKVKSNGVETHSLFYTVNDGNMDIMIKSSMSNAYSEKEILQMWKACESILKK